MGTYAELAVADYPLIASKSAVIPEVMAVFRETRPSCILCRVQNGPCSVWGEPDDPNDDEPETAS